MRERIDEIDTGLLGLVDERAALSLAISQAKGTNGHGHDAKREHDLVSRAREMATGTLDADELEMVLSAVVKASRSMQRRHALAEMTSTPES
jgi:chorismate mutase